MDWDDRKVTKVYPEYEEYQETKNSIQGTSGYDIPSEDFNLPDEEFYKKHPLSPIEERFRVAQLAFDAALKDLYAEQARINDLVRETERLKSEEFGVPVGTAREGKYVPVSMKSIFGDGNRVDMTLIDNITDYDYCNYEVLLPEGEWWVTSNTCH